MLPSSRGCFRVVPGRIFVGLAVDDRSVIAGRSFPRAYGMGRAVAMNRESVWPAFVFGDDVAGRVGHRRENFGGDDGRRRVEIHDDTPALNAPTARAAARWWSSVRPGSANKSVSRARPAGAVRR